MASFLALFVFGLSFPFIVLGAGIAGYWGAKLAPAAFPLGGSGDHADGTLPHHGPAVIDDDTPPAIHTRFRWSRLGLIVAGALALWASALWLLGHPMLQQLAIFFSKAALLTFGGAYAVLPYVYEGSVEHYQWLSGAQMMDGLALGETTPGPLIMVVSFVGFVGAWSREIFGPAALLSAGLAGAAVATAFTFLPSFMFILAGAPLVESTRGDWRFSAPLTGISAAVVGVIVNLALHFAWHVLFPNATAATPLSGGFASFQAALVMAAFLALWKFQLGQVRVIVVCAVIGWARSLWL